MPFGREEIIKEIRSVKDSISYASTIPYSLNHKYVNPNNTYERLTVYVKEWVEGVFGYYTNANGELIQIPDKSLDADNNEVDINSTVPEKGEITKNWLDTGAKMMTPLHSDWFNVALKGAKKNSNPLPTIKVQLLSNEVGDALLKDTRSDVITSFLPVYRALRDSFSKRRWYEWFTNHRQYTAERDALKVVSNLITSMTGYTEEQLTSQYNRQVASITDDEIKSLKVEAQLYQRNKERNATNDVELFSDVENIDRAIVDKKGNRVVEDVLANADGLYEEDVSREVVNQNVIQPQATVNDDIESENIIIGDVDNINSFDDSISDDENVMEVESDDDFMISKIIKFNNDKDIKKLLNNFSNTIKFNVKPSQLEDVLTEKLYKPLYGKMKDFANWNDSLNQLYPNKPEKVATELEKSAKKYSKTVFETTFDSLVKNSLCNLGNLKDVIMATQKITDVMLADRSPIAFNKSLSNYAKGYHTIENSQEIIDYIKTNYSTKFSEKQITTAVSSAKNEFGALYRGEKLDMSYVFEIGYRPNTARHKEEGKVLSEALKLVNTNKVTGKKEIDDPALFTIVNENTRRWKEVNRNHAMSTYEAEKLWSATDKKINELYPDFENNQAKNLIQERVLEKDAQKNMNKQLAEDLKEPKADVVPPVKSNAGKVIESNVKK